MGRWQPDALLRLQQAALELFLEKGYDKTTVEEIAQRAGLTQRTFFRYFADKKEVLFAGSSLFETAVIEGVQAATAAAPLERVVGAFQRLAPEFFDARTEAVRRRRSIIASSAELEERELQKMVRVADQVTQILIDAGHPADSARFAADLGVLVFRTAFARWSAEGEGTLAEAIGATLADLRRLASGPVV